MVLEYNCRWGDPETQVLVPLLKSSLIATLMAVAEGRVPPLEIETEKHACCVVLAAPGYPERPQLEIPIEGPVDDLIRENSLFVCSARKTGGAWFSSGGRVFNAMGIGATAREARSRAYAVADSIHFEGKQFRRDIQAADV